MHISDDVCLAALRGWNGWPADAPLSPYQQSDDTKAAWRRALSAAISAEREACATMLDDLAREARIARDNFKAIGNAELDAQRHDSRASAFTFGAAAIRARGE